jgi:hypothetical protein
VFKKRFQIRPQQRGPATGQMTRPPTRSSCGYRSRREAAPSYMIGEFAAVH